jgi:hypothetical protein
MSLPCDNQGPHIACLCLLFCKSAAAFQNDCAQDKIIAMLPVGRGANAVDAMAWMGTMMMTMIVAVLM